LYIISLLPAKTLKLLVLLSEMPIPYSDIRDGFTGGCTTLALAGGCAIFHDNAKNNRDKMRDPSLSAITHYTVYDEGSILVCHHPLYSI
jgi:hypothetical protein